MSNLDFKRYCESFGRNVKRLRARLELTQEDMVERGFSLRHYQRIEAGRSVTLRTILKLARAFGVQPREILPHLTAALQFDALPTERAVSRSHFWNIMGGRKSPTLEWLLKIANALEVDITDLLAHDR